MSRKSRKRKWEPEDQVHGALHGEEDNFFPDKIKDEMETMWEIPQICHFLHLTKESLNIPPFSVYEMERMLLIPKASKQLANIMTCLLSSPITKAKLRKLPPMPYDFWTNVLTYKVMSWFKVYHAKHENATKVLETIGVEPEFWNVFPDISLIEGKDFEDLTFKQRVWLLKTVCDTIMHTRKTVQEDIAKQPWEEQFETNLGVDRYGARYIYFPQFISSDLRIYKHCLDNEVFLTVRVVRPKQDTSSETTNSIRARLKDRYRRKKRQSRNGTFERSSRSESKTEAKDLNVYKCSNDSATSSFISEDTNLSSTSMCSNNNNNINLDTSNGKRCRSLSKTSEESTLSNTKSSGYDTNTSSDNKSLVDYDDDDDDDDNDNDDDENDSQMFKGFSDTQKDNYNIGIINQMLDNLRSKIDEERTSECDSDIKIIDNLSSSSKTDDEKLNEIISAENSKLPASIRSACVPVVDNTTDSLSTSKSDDEKLSETKIGDRNVNANHRENCLSQNVTFNGTRNNSPSFNGDDALLKRGKKSHGVKKEDFPLNTDSNGLTQGKSSRKMQLRSRHRAAQREKKNSNKTETVRNVLEDKMNFENIAENTDEKNSSASESRLQEDMEEDDFTNDSDIGYNLRQSKHIETDESKRQFSKLLSDISVSDFRLVVDNVEGLRNLISSFSNDSKDNNVDNEKIAPQCEVKLVMRLTELLNSLEQIETTLKDSTRKAKLKLQREWSNFKEGNVEDQDSSGESGLSSNWWILGSQGCSQSAPGDATLQTLSQLTLSPFGSQNEQSRLESEHKSKDESAEQDSCESRKSNEERNDNEKQKVEETTQGRKQVVKEKKQKRQSKWKRDHATPNGEDAEQQTRRVLRARGNHSYSEQFYSDDENWQNKLEEWAEIEAIYAAPSASADTSTPHVDPKIRHADNGSEEEDSDQDWLLPGTRKRKNRRSSVKRKLKPLQHKMQYIKENTSQSNATSPVMLNPAVARICKDKPKDTKEDRESRTLIKDASKCDKRSMASEQFNSKRTVHCTDDVCKIPTIISVHSELDIKDESPIYSGIPVSHYTDQSCYGPQQNYTTMKVDSRSVNHYVPPQNIGIVPTASSSIQQGYYMQNPPNYMIQNLQLNYVPDIQQQYPAIPQQQNPHTVVQPFANMAYMPHCYTQSQYNMGFPAPPITSQQQQRSQDSAQCTPKSQNRCNQLSRYATPQQKSRCSNSTIKTNNPSPNRSNCQRPTNLGKSQRGNLQQQRAPNPRMITTRHKPATQARSAENTGQKTTSLIVLSDSDDEIEMIITEKTASTTTAAATKKTMPNLTTDQTVSAMPEKTTVNQAKQNSTISNPVSSIKDFIPPQIIERMNQGGISITPVKNNNPPATSSSTSTQLVVVVNETGSHYALALPNGSKLILTPEQVAQIRASNGGKLIL